MVRLAALGATFVVASVFQVVCFIVDCHISHSDVALQATLACIYANNTREIRLVNPRSMTMR